MSIHWFWIKMDQKLSSVSYKIWSYLLIITNIFVIIKYVTIWKIKENEILSLILGADLITKLLYRSIASSWQTFYEVLLQNGTASVIRNHGNFCLILRKLAFFETGLSLLQTATGITKQGNFIAICGSYYKNWHALFSKFYVLDCIN